MISRTRGARTCLLTGALAISFGSLGFSQAGSASSSSDNGTYYKYSFGVFGGIQAWSTHQIPKTDKLVPGGAAGVRADQDFFNYLGVEEAWTFYAVNNLRLLPTQPYPAQTVGFGARNGQVFIGPLVYLTPRTAPVRPFLTGGPAFQYFWVTHDARIQGQATPVYNAPHMEGRNGPAIVFGGGIKFNAGGRLGIRVDAHGIYAQNPHFNLSGVPAGPGSLYIPTHGTQLGMQTSLGIDFKGGRVAPTPPPAPPPPPPPPPPAPTAMNVTVTASPTSVCPGETVNVTAQTNAPDTATYQWSVNGEQLSTARTLAFGTAGRQAGNYNVSVTVNAPGFQTGTGSTSVTVRPYEPPTGTVTATPSDLTVGDRAILSSSFRNQCDGPVHPATYTASEGTVNGNQYDSSTVQFDQANRGEQQKTITITATAADDRSSGTATTSIVVHKPANREAIRLPDIVFGRNNARVNNCGKRVLLEELKTYLDQDPTGRVVFIGHMDNGELRKLQLDQKRALNAAAIISAGKGICLNFNASQIMIVAAGTNQADDFKPYFCEASVRERGGSRITAADRRAQNRRVEVWFVPTNGNMPASAANAKDAASMGVGRLGCPR